MCGVTSIMLTVQRILSNYQLLLVVGRSHFSELLSHFNINERKREVYYYLNNFLFEDDRCKQVKNQLKKLLGKFRLLL